MMSHRQGRLLPSQKVHPNRPAPFWLQSVQALVFAWVAALGVMPTPVHAQVPMEQIAAGLRHTCALSIAGEVKCWGDNSQGQLGVGDTDNQGDQPGQMGDALEPIDLPKAHGPIVQVVAGNFHTCALAAAGDVFCWGSNAYGQLGLGHSNSIGDNPGEVNSNMTTPIHAVRKLTAGGSHTCALGYDGVVLCWGFGAYGQLGTGDGVNRRDAGNLQWGVPNLGTGRKAVDIGAAQNSTCALLDNNKIKCWGYNVFGTLGLGDAAGRGDNAGEMGDALPAVAVPLSEVGYLAVGGYHVCAAAPNADVQIKCWGLNGSGQLGLGDTNARGDQPGELQALPVLPGAFVPWKIVLGAYHTCKASMAGFSMKCWGYNSNGQLGLGDTANRGDTPGEVADNLPTAVSLGTVPGTNTPHTVRDIAAGGFHTCVLLGEGSVKCWGLNAQGQLGQGDTVDRGSLPGQLGNALAEVDL